MLELTGTWVCIYKPVEVLLMWQYGYGGKVKDEFKEMPDSTDAEAQKKRTL